VPSLICRWIFPALVRLAEVVVEGGAFDAGHAADVVAVDVVGVDGRAGSAMSRSTLRIFSSALAGFFGAAAMGKRVPLLLS
jgi:hypothetical protein